MKKVGSKVAAAIAAVMSMVMGGNATAQDAVMTNTVTKIVSWTDLANWTDSSGAPLTEVPTGATVNVSFPNAPVGVSRQTEKMDVFVNNNAKNVTALGGVSDSPNAEGEDWSRRRILFDNPASTVQDYAAQVTIGNPDGFYGYWSFSRSLGTLILPATDTYTPKLSNLSAKARPTVEVAEAKARLGSVFENGAVRKTGAGELEVGETTGAGTRFYVSEGDLTLCGSADGAATPEDGDDLPVPGAALHLDATVGASLVTTNETEHETGRTFVTKWSDVRGNGLYAYHDGKAISGNGQIPFANAPFLNTTDACGKTFVDFGSATAGQKNAGYGPTNCLLRLSQKLTDCREVFLVASKISADATTAPLGDASVYPFHYGSGILISDQVYGTPPENVRHGFILVNGEVTGNETPWPSHLSPTETQLAVASFGTTNGVTLSLVGTDRYYAGRSGGWRLGEVVIYTNVLTTAERYAVHHHLQAKWQGADAASVGAVVLNPGASVGVPEGRTAKVAELTAINGTLVKTGAGTLEVGGFSGKTDATVKSLDIRGGSVKITGLPAADDTKPADGALLWLDANDRTSFVFTNKTGDVDYVGEWHDCRPEQTTVWARLPKDPGGASSEGRDLVKGDGDVPTRIENVVNGLAVVDFGAYKGQGKGGNSFMVLNTPSYSTANACEAFLVQESSATSRGAIFGYGTGTSMIRSGITTALLNDTSYGSHLGRNAVMTLNGVQIDPCAPGQAALTTGTFDVYSVSAQALLPLTLIGGKDRIGQSSAFGGCQVGELILYDRKLTPAERRQTIAYLMKKWQNRTPQFATTPGALGTKFADDIPATFDVVDDLEVTSLAGSNGSIVKRGAGTVALPETTVTSAGAVLVEEGTLVTLFHTEPEIPQPLVRYDASEPSSFTGKYVGEDGETRVTSLASLGSYSRTLASSKGNGGAVTNPAVETVEMRPGVSRPCFNFGYRGGTLASGNGATAFHGSCSKTVVEYYAIVADNVASTSPSYQNLFSNIGSPTTYFKRGTGGKLLANDANEKVRNGYLAVDGVKTEYTEALPMGFHLFTAVPTEALPISYICMARESNTGGLKMSEMIIYDQPNTPEVRTYLQKKLMHKWFDTPMPTWDFSIESVSVAEGATWRDTAENMKIFVGEATLAGSVEVEDLSVSTALTLAGAAMEKGDLTLADGIAISLAAADASLAVDGTLTFSGAAAVTLDDPAFAKLDEGEYTVFEATEIVGFDPRAVTLDASALATRRIFSLVPVADDETGKVTAVRLHVEKPGMMLLVR